MNKIQKADLYIHFGNEKLEEKEFAKCLGVFIDSKFTWEKQIQITKLLTLNCKKEST